MEHTDIVPPTGASVDCTRFEAQCGGYLERDLDQAERAWMTAHQSGCAECAALVRELETIVAESQALPGISPSRDLWSGIEARLDTAVIPISAAATRTRIARTVSVRTFAIAATMLVAVTSGITWRIAVRSEAQTASPTASSIGVPSPVAAKPDSLNDLGLPGAAVELVAVSPSTTSSAPARASGSTTRLASRNAARDTRDDTDADVVYEREISALRRIVDDRVVELDTATVRELRRNLDIIDRAIGDSRKALARDPRSALLSTQLDRALETKLALLRRVALL
ncbi:hypothetical protein [Gemmatimonas groenlandica]|uniref:Zinc-finger domain-containing protein n=1 Tax=Gemmatimonas groenlandica TaxID=2732249 RepID=A0A6M4IG72_9BACT|nr:hypothetical protein [Gemmatimonas groenlandica]QJR34094.1 hypothetical protein HKW67_00480 [Gemmatimonas groenlandica]